VFKSNLDSEDLNVMGLLDRDSSLEEALKMTPAPPTNTTVNMIA